MNKSHIVSYSLYLLLISLYAISFRIFSYGYSITNATVQNQLYNLSGLVLLFAIAVTFNVFLFKSAFELKKLEQIKIKN